MIAYFDTSLIVGRYIPQENGTRFAIEASEQCETILVSEFTVLEAKNALRAACFRKEISSEELTMALEALQDDLSNSNLTLIELDANLVFQVTDQIAHSVIPAQGGRTLDLLHLGYAMLLEVDHFATADKRQAACAESQGLEVLLIT